MDRKGFGQYIKRIRKTSNLTQAEVAAALGVRYSQSIANLESGRVRFPEKHVATFCQIMNLDRIQFMDMMTEVYKEDLLSKVQTKKLKKSA